MSRYLRHARTAFFIVAPLLASAGGALAQAPQAQKEPTISFKLGDLAPAFTPGTWIKGTPVKALAKGQIYVVEFWATWCGPCKAAIPHVTELARKYKDKVTFIGLNVQEKGKGPEAIDQRVAAFVKERGDTMDYLVCRDTTDQAMEKTWLDASGHRGIPATFIVDGTGRLVWTGHPMRMEPVIQKVLAGTFDPAAEVAAAKAKSAAFSAVENALKAKEWQKALDLTGAITTASKEEVLWIGMLKLTAYLHLDEKTAETIYEATAKADPEAPAMLANCILREDGLPKAWYQRTLPAFEEMVKKDKAYYTLLSKAQFKAGDFKHAAESKAADLEQFRARMPQILEEHPDAGQLVQDHLKQLEQELKEYRAAAKS